MGSPPWRGVQTQGVRLPGALVTTDQKGML